MASRPQLSRRITSSSAPSAPQPKIALIVPASPEKNAHGGKSVRISCSGSAEQQRTQTQASGHRGSRAVDAGLLLDLGGQLPHLTACAGPSMRATRPGPRLLYTGPFLEEAEPYAGFAHMSRRVDGARIGGGRRRPRRWSTGFIARAAQQWRGGGAPPLALFHATICPVGPCCTEIGDRSVLCRQERILGYRGPRIFQRKNSASRNASVRPIGVLLRWTRQGGMVRAMDTVRVRSLAREILALPEPERPELAREVLAVLLTRPGPAAPRSTPSALPVSSNPAWASPEAWCQKPGPSRCARWRSCRPRAERPRFRSPRPDGYGRAGQSPARGAVVDGVGVSIYNFGGFSACRACAPSAPASTEC